MIWRDLNPPRFWAANERTLQTVTGTNTGVHADGRSPTSFCAFAQGGGAMKLSAIVSLLIAANASPQVILDAIIAWEQSTEDAHSIARDKANARWQKWKDSNDAKLQTNVEGMPPTYTNNSRAPARAEGSSSKKVISGQKSKEDMSPNGSILPKDFVPKPGVAKDAGLTREEFEVELAQFKDHWAAKAGKDARKKDWQAAWRMWCRNAVKYRKERTRDPTYAEQSMDDFKSIWETGNESKQRQVGNGHRGNVVSLLPRQGGEPDGDD